MSTPSPEPTPVPLPPTAPDGTVRLLQEPSRVVVLLSGEVDDELRPDLEDVAAQVVAGHADHPRPVHVDATAVSFMDSAGAAFLARLAVAVRPERVTISPSESVAFLLEVTRLSDVLDLAANDTDGHV